MKLHPVYLHFPDWQFKSYFLILSVMVLDQFCLGFVWLILRFFWGGGQICEKYVPSTCYIFLSSPPHPLKKLQNVLQRGEGQIYERYVPSTCYSFLFPPPPPPLKKRAKCPSKGGRGSKTWEIRPQHLLLFFSPNFPPPPQFSKILLKWGGGGKQKSIVL